MINYQIRMTPDAENDLLQLDDYISNVLLVPDIALQYVGDVATLDDVIYTSIFIKDQMKDEEGNDIVTRLWVKDGKLALTYPVTEDNKTGEEKKSEEEQEEGGHKIPPYTDTEKKFGDEEENPIDRLTNKYQNVLDEMNDGSFMTFD